MAAPIGEAVRALNSLQSNAATLEKTRMERDKYVHRKLIETTKMAERAQITLDEIDKLSIIHVSGTKGKGSTCALTESILRRSGYRTGFFSSPHLVEVRERIRINGAPLSTQAFSQYFWDIFHRLNHTKEEHGGEMPPYFKFLTIMAFHVFLQEKVDVAIMEVGIGGQYDCTNIMRHPVVCGVTSLGIDHQSILGNTIDKIAWQKAGIFKRGVPAVTVPQPEVAMEVLKSRAVERQCPLYVTPSYDSYPGVAELQLGIAGAKQKLNAALALQLCSIWINNHTHDLEDRQQLYPDFLQPDRQPDLIASPAFALPPNFRKGLSECRWAGRNQIMKRPRVTYYIDGAHTTSSIEQCVEWFTEAATREEIELEGSVARVLMFNVTGERSPTSLLQHFLELDFDAGVFCPNIASAARIRADQENLTVTRSSQLKRCLDCQAAWDQLLAARPQRRLSAHLSADSPSPSAHLPADSPSSSAHLSADSPSSPPHQQHISSSHHSLASQSNLSDFSDFDSGLESDASSRGLGHSPSSVTSSLRSTPDRDTQGFVFDCIVDSLHWISQGSNPDLPSKCASAEFRPVPLALRNADHIQVLCTGSLHLIGGVLGVLDPDLNTHSAQ